MDQIEVLFHDYNYYRAFTASVGQARAQGRYIPELKRTKERDTALRALVVWCEKGELDARLWLYSLFVSRQWVLSPPFSQLISEKHKIKYQKLTALDRYDQRMRETAGDSGYDPNRDLSGTVEAKKRHFLEKGQVAKCMKAVFDTLGFHPKSVVCAGCSACEACAMQLRRMVPFDILALRRGDITADQARAQVGMGKGHA